MMLKKRNGGFTLVELVVTISIIAIMSALGISIVVGTSSLKAERRDKMALVEMNNIFMEEWGAESYAYPQTAADIKLRLNNYGYDFRQPQTAGGEWWFDTYNGRMSIGFIKDDKLILDYGSASVELAPNDSIITPDGFLQGYVYMGEKYRPMLDAFSSIDVDVDGVIAQDELNTLLNNSDYPYYIRKSLATLAENALFIGHRNVLSFNNIRGPVAILQSGGGEDEFNFEALPSKDGRTLAVFAGSEREFDLDAQFKDSYIKSLYVPSDITIASITEDALSGSWIQRILVNTEEGTLTQKEIINKSADSSLQFVVPVLKKYYPSELPAYDLDERRIDKFLNLYNEHKNSSEEFEIYYRNELISKDSIDELYTEFYKLKPFERQYIIHAYKQEPIYETITDLHATGEMLAKLYDKVLKAKFAEEELLLGETYSFEDKLSAITESLVGDQTKSYSAFDERNKLFANFESESSLELLENSTRFNAVARGKANIYLQGVLSDTKAIPYVVCGSYQSIDITSIKLSGNTYGVVKNQADFDIDSKEIFGAYDYNGVGLVITPNASGKGEFIHSSEGLVIEAINAAPQGEHVQVIGGERATVNVTVTVRSKIDPNVKANISLALKGNTCNLFASDELNLINKDKYNIAFHSDVTSTSQSTWTVSQNRTVYGNGYTFKNTTKGAQDSSQTSEFRFPAVVTVYGTIENLKIIAKTGSELGIVNRFNAIVNAENGATKTRHTAGGVKNYEGTIANTSWSGTEYSLLGVKKGSVGPIYLLSKRLAAVRVYGSGKLYNCVVEGGQYGIHLIGNNTALNGKLNLQNVWVHNSLAANIYVSDNEGAMQYLALDTVHIKNDDNMSAAFPMLIEPKVNAVSASTEGTENVGGYGVCLKYYYGLLEGKLSINVASLFVYNTVTYNEYFEMLYQNTIENLVPITKDIKSAGKVLDYFKLVYTSILDDMKYDFSKNSGTINVPISYGEQNYLQIYDQLYAICDTGVRKAVSSSSNVTYRTGFVNLIENYNGYKRSTYCWNALGTNETAVSYYNVPTNSGGTWNPNISL